MPAMDGSPVPFDWYGFDPDTIGEHYTPNGWAGFVVFNRWRHEDFYARYLIAVLDITGVDKPTPETAHDLPIRAITDKIPHLDENEELKYRNTTNEAVYTTYVRTPGKTLRMWGAERLGALDVVEADDLLTALKGEFKDTHTPREGVASIEHLMTLGSFHHNSGWNDPEVSVLSAATDMPLARFLKR